MLERDNAWCGFKATKLCLCSRRSDPYLLDISFDFLLAAKHALIEGEESNKPQIADK